MLKPRPSARHGKGGPRTRITEKVVAGIATLSLVASMCPGTMALAYANDQLAASAEVPALSAQADIKVPANAQQVTSDTHELNDGTYRVTGKVEIKPDGSGNGIRVKKDAKVLLYLDEGAELTVTGADAKETGVGHAAILLPAGSTLTVGGKGTLNATGGKAGYAEAGREAGGSSVLEDSFRNKLVVGKGGNGGAGGGGAGAGIGTDGGAGGKGGAGGDGYRESTTASNVYGHDGNPGSAGAQAAPAGTLIVTDSAAVVARGGKPGKGGAGGRWGSYEEYRSLFTSTSAGTSGGGGGGGGGSAADGIGSGGSGGGGGGGGASANIDGEGTCFGNLDDLWGYGGLGGEACWGASAGEQGSYGASVHGSRAGDDTDASRKYAKRGGAGGSSPELQMVTFFTYVKDGQSGSPSVNCIPGPDRAMQRGAVVLPNIEDYKAKGGYVVGSETKKISLSEMWNNNKVFLAILFTLDKELLKKAVANPAKAEQLLLEYLNKKKAEKAQSTPSAPPASAGDGASADKPESAQVTQGGSGPTPLATQGDGREAYVDSGTVDYDGMKLTYAISCYDSEGGALSSAPSLPGQYVIALSFTSPEIEAGTHEPIEGLIVPCTITKRQVAKPEPAALTFACADWETGEGAEQDAFPGLDSADYEFVGGAEAPEGLGDLKSSTSLKSAKEAGSYAACFKLKDPETCQWEGEPEDADEAWVPWSVKLQELDPNDLTYWGASYDDEATAVTYTGEPQWVRPWFTPAKDTNGKLPAWLTHWGSGDRLKNDKNSAVVLYLQGDDDEQGLVGYHTNADGSLEPVTGAQVYAWANGVDIDGRHVAVQSGEKVWYRTGEGGWWVPLAVQDERPEGADGFVVARDFAYVDRPGVRDVGTYEAYALFDEGAGFAPTALAHATVEVKAATAPVAAAKTPKTGAEPKASASSTPKTGDLSPLALGGLALAALLGAGALALSLARRRG